MRLFLGVIFFTCFILQTVSVEAQVRYVSQSPSKTVVVEDVNNDSLLAEDIEMVEDYIFGRIYPKETLNRRLSRIENRLFNRLYAGRTNTDRVNNILRNYRNAYRRNYINNNARNSFVSRFVGVPTGFTPPIDYYNNSGWHNSYQNNYGYGYTNRIPTFTNAGIHILK